MSTEIILTLTILIGAVLLFITERLRVDAVALLVLVALALTGLVTPAEALSGFSSPAVVTVWAMFILSGGLSVTGVANMIGRQVLRLAGDSEWRLVMTIMLLGGALSAFMNNVAVTAMLLPVVVDIARRTRHPPSKLLIPLAFGSLLGGLNTLIGTPPNLLVSMALNAYGLSPFRMFDYTPLGLTVMLTGVAYMVLLGRRLLPDRKLAQSPPDWDVEDLGQFYDLRARLFVVRVPHGSALAGKTLAESRLGAALGLNVVLILRNGRSILSPGLAHVIEAGDRLLIEGRSRRLVELGKQPNLTVEAAEVAVEALTSAETEVVEAEISPRSELAGRTLRQINLRNHLGVNILALRRGDALKRTNLQDTPLRPGDKLLCQGARPQIEALKDNPDLILPIAGPPGHYNLCERLFTARVPENSSLAGKTLTESRLGDAFGLTVLGIVRGGASELAPGPDERILAGDVLLIEGQTHGLDVMQGLQSLEIECGLPPELADLEIALESERIGMVEAALSPHTTLSGKTLRQISFREKYGLSVLAIWRQGKSLHSDLRDVALRFGDALLLYGPREKLKLLSREPDFLLLTTEIQPTQRRSKAGLAVALMAGVLLSAALKWIAIPVAAVTGAVAMVLTGCLSMDEAYRFIKWRVVFLIAGMLPLSIALEHSGAARLLAESMLTAIGEMGPLAVLAGLFVVIALTAQIVPTHAVAVLMMPIAFNVASRMGISPYATAMVVAFATSASFLLPVGHPANVLIMGPGGYRFSDYARVGAPLTLLILVVVLLVTPYLWPLFP